MGVRYVISDPEPEEPTWWAKNKAIVCAGIGLAAGLWLAGACDHHGSATPDPATSTSPAATATPHGSAR